MSDEGRVCFWGEAVRCYGLRSGWKRRQDKGIKYASESESEKVERDVA